MEAIKGIYPRTRMQEASLLYKTSNHPGRLSLHEVNTFLAPRGASAERPNNTARDKDIAIAPPDDFVGRNVDRVLKSLIDRRHVCLQNQHALEVHWETMLVAILQGRYPPCCMIGEAGFGGTCEAAR
ncbi:MAG: hypothetical protein KTR25_14150 [Myxococcales bacterium]|nr:hypothetical protein [Myxococcales bacterium]